MKLLAIDLGTRTGWAYRDDEGERWGVWELDATGIKGDAPRLDLFARHLSRACDECKPDLLAVEEPFMGGENSMRTARVTFGLMGFLEVIAYRLKIPVRFVNPADIKRSALGWVSRKATHEERATTPGGRIWAKGPDVLKAVNARRAGSGRLLIADHNSAIAVAILDLLAAELRGTGEVKPSPLARLVVKKARGRRPKIDLLGPLPPREKKGRSPKATA